jgi:hypothetical protein
MDLCASDPLFTQTWLWHKNTFLVDYNSTKKVQAQRENKSLVYITVPRWLIGTGHGLEPCSDTGHPHIGPYHYNLSAFHIHACIHTYTYTHTHTYSKHLFNITIHKPTFHIHAYMHTYTYTHTSQWHCASTHCPLSLQFCLHVPSSNEKLCT